RLDLRSGDRSPRAHALPTSSNDARDETRAPRKGASMRSSSLLAPLTLLALGAVACASHVDGDGAAAGSDALGSGTVLMLTGSSRVTATDATITVAYTSAIATTPPSTITLTGATGSYSLPA